MSRVAIVGMACLYPDASSPGQLWENALAGRRAFRRLPDERLPLTDYWDEDPAAPDRFYSRNAAVIEGYEFDRVRYRISGRTYRSTDLTHWVALDVAAQALADAGFPDGAELPRERTGVVVGNSLTGEFTRANTLRLRWPYVRRTVEAALAGEGWPPERVDAFLATLERDYKRPFPGVDEDTLAGGLSNTIAGRICNHFDLKGGGYTVDGACSSSLLSVATACTALVAGDVDVAVAGGVDLSIDPFEMIGFAKTGALAAREMRVYDRGSNGFWPGEGCGMVVLVREPDAIAAGRRVYATVAGWGVSSDGSGGITRPEVDGYRLALSRAYARAGFGVETVPVFEGHGTGTAVGDATELRALSGARLARDPRVAPAAISSVKAVIGHTKAAAGVAGLIKATMAVREEVVPPTVGCVDPHPVLAGEGAALRVARSAEAWPDGAPVRAGVTAMGFGGINTHIVLESPRPRRRPLDARTRALASSAQDAELLLLDAGSPDGLRRGLAELADAVPAVSYAQLGDLAAAAASELTGGAYRAAVVAVDPGDARRRLRRLLAALDKGLPPQIAVPDAGFLGHVRGSGRVGYLFPGQGSGRSTDGGALRARLREVDALYARFERDSGRPAGDPHETAVAQPRLVTAAAAGLAALRAVGIDAEVAVGHSLGELSALHWAGALDERQLLRIATDRGRIMTERATAGGAMAGVGAPTDVATELAEGLPLVVAGYNGPRQTVLSGAAAAVDDLVRRARAAGVPCLRLPVSHAFHSPLVAPAATVLGERLAGERFARVRRRVVSTVTGDPLPEDVDLPGLLSRQVTAPVRFGPAVEVAAKEVDLFVEVGPGRVLTGLAASVNDVPVVPLDTDAGGLRPFLEVVGAAHVLGVPMTPARLFADRLVRPVSTGGRPRVFANPCETAAPGGLVERGSHADDPPVDGSPAAGSPSAGARPQDDGAAEPEAEALPGETPLELLRRLVAERAELPVELVTDDSRLLDGLHLSSITVGNVFTQVARLLGVPTAQPPVNVATASLRELAEALEHAAEGGTAADVPADVAGAASWVRAFRVDLDEEAAPEAVVRDEPGPWTARGRTGRVPAERLRAALERAALGPGLLLCLPEDCSVEDLAAPLEAAKAAVSAAPGTRVAVVQGARGAAGLAKTLRQEAPQLRVTVVHLAPGPEDPGLVRRIVAEVEATDGFSEVHLDAGGRRVPTLRALPIREPRTSSPLDRTDVLLVTGGGKGITAECALMLAGESGARLAVLGRSDPAEDTELAANLRRMADGGSAVAYARADVADDDAVRAAVAKLTAELGPVTAVLHGAGRNEPARLGDLDLSDVRATLAPKVDGLRAVLAAVGEDELRLLVTFGSIIGRAGLRGEAHYATANEWLAELTQEFARRHPACRTLCLEWSVWSGVGMGERLEVAEALAREGITAITPDQGLQLLRRLVADPEAPTLVVVSGRTGAIDTVRREVPELPLLRFVGRPLVRYHGTELVAEVDLDVGTDPYLADHRLDGDLLFPAVLGIEAMAQVAHAATGWSGVPVLEDLEFLRPIVVPAQGATTVRVAAAVVDDDVVQVAVRVADTGFAADHFRGRLRYGASGVLEEPSAPAAREEPPPIRLDPESELYGGLLFQGARFRRLRGYRRLAAREVDAEVWVTAPEGWFAPFLPSDLVLGDPGYRDALMHGIQVCVPDATLLPEAVDRIQLAPATSLAPGLVRVSATERRRTGDSYVYDVVVRDGSGRVVERWDGLRLRAVRKLDGRGPWPVPLLGPYLQRRLEDLLDARVAIAAEPAEPSSADAPGVAGFGALRRTRTEAALWRAAGARLPVGHRPDGRPMPADGREMSAAHTPRFTLCVLADRRVACDAEPVVPRPDADREALLGRYTAVADLLVTGGVDTPDAATTRVWAAVECLRKTGLPGDAPLSLVSTAAGPWQVFASGSLRVATLLTTVRGGAEPTVLAVLAEGGS